LIVLFSIPIALAAALAAPVIGNPPVWGRSPAGSLCPRYGMMEKQAARTPAVGP